MESGIEIITGIVLLVLGLSFLLNGKSWGGIFRTLLVEPGQSFTMILLFMICGLLIVLGHNLWVADWRVLVTVTGWAAFIKCAVILIAPRLLTPYSKVTDATFAMWARLGGLLWIVGGGIVTYFSRQSRRR